jgi:hypothetical protein
MMKSSSVAGLLLLAVAVFIAFIFISPAYTVSAAGNFSCAITTSGSCSYTKVLYMQNDTGGYQNAHTQNVTPGTYAYAVCCDSNSTLSLGCGEGVLLKLNATTNAHAQRGDYVGPGITYGVDACISVNPGYFNCTYVDDACPADRECFASMASASSSENNDTDAHLGSCTYYRRKICCKIIPRLSVSYVSPTPSDGVRRVANTATINVTVSSDSGVTVNTCTLEWNGANETMTKRGSGSSVSCDTTKATADGTDYTFNVYANDTVGNLANETTRHFRENDEPEKVVLTSPANQSHTTDRTPTFQWSVPSDADSDTLNYTINITCFGGCSDDNRMVQDITTNSYTPTLELKYFGDDNYYYNWSVRAGDGYEFGNWSDVWRLIIDTNVTIIMLNNTVDFGENRPPHYADNSSDNSPYPFSLRNTGNCMINVNISASDMLWDTVSTPSAYFTYKAASLSGEGGAFNWSGSQTAWSSVSSTNAKIVDYLNYTTGNNSFETDIGIEVPFDEPPGAKSSTLVFTGEYHGQG